MFKYSMLRVMAGFLQLIGWIMVALSVFLFFVSLSLLQPNAGSSTASLSNSILAFGAIWWIASAGTLFLMGLFAVIFGQLVGLFIDIARNTARLHEIAANAAKTTGFFEHISGKANRAPVGTAQELP